MEKRKKIYIIAGEPSGDFLGAGLIHSLKVLSPEISLRGIGGPLMEKAGLGKSFFPIEDLAVMGFFEILPHIFNLKKRINETIDDIVKMQPDILVTIDSPGFTFRVSKAIRKRLGNRIKLVHYVAPSVWAWKPGRAKKIARFLDHLLTILPFEPPYFEKEGLPTTFVGHSLADLIFNYTPDPLFRQKYNIPKNAPLLTILPGSRQGELKRHLPIFKETAERLQSELPSIWIAIQTFPAFEPEIKKNFTLPNTVILTSSEDKLSLFSESTVALAASGTVTLELAGTNTPMVVAYKISPLTYHIVRHLVSLNYVSLVNILLGRGSIPECLQDRCTPSILQEELIKFLGTKSLREKMKKDLAEAFKLIQPPLSGKTCSDIAAETILKIL